MEKRIRKPLLLLGGILLLCIGAVSLYLIYFKQQPDPQATFVLGRWFLFG